MILFHHSLKVPYLLKAVVKISFLMGFQRLLKFIHKVKFCSLHPLHSPTTNRSLPCDDGIDDPPQLPVGVAD
ncbi:hypothetical protein WJ978_04065 [Achromobacter xylosoxidans]